MPLPARIEAELAHFRDAFAASATLADDELLCRRPRPAPRARPEAKLRPPAAIHPPPRFSRQYAGPIATRCARDRRLHGTAVKLALWVRASAGNRGRMVLTTKGYIARKLGFHPRTISRQLAALVELGYVVVQRWTSASGADLGLMIFVTDLLLPFYLLEREGVTRLFPTKGSKKKRASRGAGYRPQKNRQGAQREEPCPPKAAACPS